MDSKEIFCLIIIIILILVLICICNEKPANNFTNYATESTVSNSVTNEVVDTKKYNKDIKMALNNEDDNKIVYLNESNKNDYKWNEYIIEEKEILKDMPEIDFSKFEKLDDEFYTLKITDYKTYNEYYENYNLIELKEEDFDYIFTEIIIRKSTQNAIKYSDIITGYEYVRQNNNYRFPVRASGKLKNSKNIKYPCIVGYFPNYMNEYYSDLYFNVIVQNEDIKVSKEEALETAQKYLEDLTYKECSNFSNMDYIRLDKVYGNNFIKTENKEKPVEDNNKKYTVWSISAYSEDDPCTWANVYIDTITGKIIGGILYYATD